MISRSVLKKLESKSAIHRLVMDAPAKLLRALFDPLRAERFIYNLVDNAIKYSPGGCAVKVSIRQDGDYLIWASAIRGRAYREMIRHDCSRDLSDWDPPLREAFRIPV